MKAWVGALLFVGGLLVGYLVRGVTDPRGATPEGAREPLPVADIIAPDAPEPDAGRSLGELLAGLPTAAEGWTPSEFTDEMRGTTTRLMCIWAAEPLRLRFPYEGARARFCLRNSPEMGRDAYFQVTEGQVLCGYGGCRVPVRFDDEAVSEWRATGAEHSSELLFMRDADGFARRLLTASRFMIEVELYGAGRRQVLFEHAGGLTWEIPRGRRR